MCSRNALEEIATKQAARLNFLSDDSERQSTVEGVREGTRCAHREIFARAPALACPATRAHAPPTCALTASPEPSLAAHRRLGLARAAVLHARA
eukprot:1012783-Prymnesium_polylepis.1